jgi:tellurite resistance protein
MTDKPASLLEKDFCVRGHDVRDKENSLRIYSRGRSNRQFVACVLCSRATNSASMKRKTRGEKKVRHRVSLEGKLRREIYEIVDTLDDTELMKLLLQLKNK